MPIRIRYFATFKDLTGKTQDDLEAGASITVQELKDLLAERYEKLREALPTALVAVNREFAFPEDRVEEGDEVAIFPPVSGGAPTGVPTVLRITEAPIDLNELLKAITLPTTGASCMFSGMVREVTRRGESRRTDHLEYEAFQEMAEAKLDQVTQEIRAHWPLVEGIAIVQRIGHLEPGTPTVLIACTAGHRDSGVFEAARYGIDRLKQIVPIWKKEVGPDGEIWIEGSYLPEKSDRRP